MKTPIQLNSIANFIDINTLKNNHSITPEFTFNAKEEVLNRSEKLIHNKRQQMQEVFYKEIAVVILKYKNVLLFGPTNAKTELHNYQNTDLHFKGTKFKIKSLDNMVYSHYEKSF